jgi:DNA-binding MarR family transcriptional regulator
MKVNCTDRVIYATFVSVKNRPEDPQSIDVATLAAELRAVIGKLRRRMRKQTNSLDLTSSQVSVLVGLEKGSPATVSALARAEGMRPQSMSSVVATLEAAGLVTSAPDPTDKRQSLLSLTETYRKKVREDRSARQDWLSRVLQAHLSPREQAQLAAAVELMKRLAED